MKRIIFLTLISLILSTFGVAANQVDLAYYWGDTIWTDQPGYFIVSVAVDSFVSGLNLGFGMSSPDGVSWLLDEVGGFETDPPGPRFVRGVPGSDWMNGAASDGSCWDVAGTVVKKNLAPNQFLISGEALSGGLTATTLQPMLEIHFTPLGAYGNDIKTLCIDSMYYPSSTSDAFLFTPGGPPEVLWGNTALCFPVRIALPPHCPFWGSDNPMSVSVSHTDTARARVHAFYPEGDDVFYYLVGVTGGTGTATINLFSGDVTYIPNPSDAGRTVAIEIEATDAIHTSCLYNTCTVLVTVTNNAPTIDCGNPYNMADGGTLFKKFDIAASDPDPSDNIRYKLYASEPFIPAGIYSIDSVTGVVSFYPVSPDDNEGDFTFLVEASDGIDATSCSFHIYVCTCEDYAGDADGSGEVDVGDALAVIAYIFKGAGGPVNMNWADVNADCEVDIADAVYLISYIFKQGPAPQVGCYY